MKPPLFRPVPVLVMVALILGSAWTCAAWVIRQPLSGSSPWLGSTRAEPSRLSAHVRFLADPAFPRDPSDPVLIGRVEAYLRSVFSKHTARCSEQVYTAGSLSARNLVAHFGPEHGPRIIVGAHYDAYGGLPGADDNASGVAALLELARMLEEAPLKHPVDLVAYSTEEPPFFSTEEMGSWVHAASLKKAGVEVRAMICIEMIGYFAKERAEAAPWMRALYPVDDDFIAVVGRLEDRNLVGTVTRCFRGASALQAVSYSGPTGMGADLSDHRNYWSMGYPAVMVTDTAFLRNPHYHLPTDTADTLDVARMAQVVDGLYNTVLHLAQ